MAHRWHSEAALFEGDEWIDHFNWGERVDNTPTPSTTSSRRRRENLGQLGRVARELSKAGIRCFTHTTMEWPIEEHSSDRAIDKELPVGICDGRSST